MSIISPALHWLEADVEILLRTGLSLITRVNDLSTEFPNLSSAWKIYFGFTP